MTPADQRLLFDAFNALIASLRAENNEAYSTIRSLREQLRGDR